MLVSMWAVVKYGANFYTHTIFTVVYLNGLRHNLDLILLKCVLLPFYLFHLITSSAAETRKTCSKRGCSYRLL